MPASAGATSTKNAGPNNVMTISALSNNAEKMLTPGTYSGLAIVPFSVTLMGSIVGNTFIVEDEIIR